MNGQDENAYELALFDIENDVQDTSSLAWKKLCEYVDIVAKEGHDEFSPYEYVGPELFSQIHTLPPSIATLKNVKKIWLYGSQLKRIPPEIGAMESLEYFDPYTSYKLHWFPYEITNCKNLKDSRVSTRALYGNHKYRRPFPDLKDNPVRYDNTVLQCSICKKELNPEETNQVWISLQVGTDVLPLLVNLCSTTCESRLPQPPKNYIDHPHKGGSDLKQPMTLTERWEIERADRIAKEEVKPSIEKETPSKKRKGNNSIDISNMPTLKLIKKIWKK